MNPLVSIVTPSYNQAAFLEDTIRSVLAQDYSPVEYLIVDGVSTDSSLEIIQRYANRLAWWVSEPDAGQAEAINKGMQRTQGEIVAWLNSDDLYLPGAISRAVAALQKNPELGMVFGDAITIDPQGRPLNRLVFDNWGLHEFVGFRVICQPAVFMRRAVFEKAGCMDPSYHFMLDHNLWVRMAQLAPVQYIGSTQKQTPPLAAARSHPNAKNVAQAAGFGRETLRMLEWMQHQPGLVPLIESNRQHVLAGAYRLNARYLLDGGVYWESLLSYGRACLAWPKFALKHWHRVVYAMLCLLGIKPLLDRLRLKQSTRQQIKLAAELRTTGQAGWPGLCLDDAAITDKAV